MGVCENGDCLDHAAQEPEVCEDDLNPDEVTIKGSCRPSGSDNGPDLSLWHTHSYNGSSTTGNFNLQPLEWW